MIYLLIFWIFAILLIVGDFIGSYSNSKRFKSFKEEYGILFILLLVSFVLIAIVTKDPINVAGVAIPAEIQWLGSLLISGFGAWRYYLDPLKKKVYGMDREIGEVKTSIKHIEKHIDEVVKHK